MQLTPRYLVNNRINILANEAGFVTEVRQVYQRQLKIFSGIDNVLEFRLLNADSKPIDMDNYTAVFVAYDENMKMIITHDGVQVQDGDSSATTNKGVFKVTITENDLLNVKSQYLSYNIYLKDADDNKVLTYTDAHFDGCGTIYVDTCQFPGPSKTHSVTTFTELETDTWYSESIDAQPGINGNEALHTIALYQTNFDGDVTVQATLDNQVTDSTTWSDVKTFTVDGDSTQEIIPQNFTGVFSHLRFKVDANPANKISKILIRN